ncbi:uncharacterized protein LOC130657195 [Hydractinia symbiolongicarpus]|uniref:uncharacterized protein LOC130657195 n=1 Tax=Hydractinia symbiolongicarpus TaxID=13093 RepID=UPI00254B3708|nr:uncharacterized protein LOC130657195 [Hydractinia symbiolongicarpus]
MATKKQFIVIGAGHPRNGTLSTKSALEIILPGKCYHMETAVMYHQKEWKSILNDDMSDEEFKNFFLSNGYVAGVDSPVSLFYERMMKVFPNAKVLLNVREPRLWERSMNETIVKVVTGTFKFPEDVFEMLGLFKSYLFHAKMFVRTFLQNDRFREMFESVKSGNGVAYYNNWVGEVKRSVPEEKLLVFSVKEGWEPLCKFLDVPVPEQPFPHANDTATFKARFAVNHRRSVLLLYELITIPIGLFLFYKSFM